MTRCAQAFDTVPTAYRANSSIFVPEPKRLYVDEASRCSTAAPPLAGRSRPARKIPFSTEDARLLSPCATACCAASACPPSLYGDRRGVFVRNDRHWLHEEQLGVTDIAAQSPQTKVASGVLHIGTLG